MKCTFLLFLIFLSPLSILIAQDYQISGSVLDNDQNPLVFASVLLEDKDGKLVLGASTDAQGLFQLRKVVAGEYVLYASYIETKSGIKSISVTEDMDVGALIISGETLDEVVVTNQKPTLVQKADRHVFNIENTALADSDIWTVLKRTPGVIIVNDKLTVNNIGNIGILINGRRVNIPESDVINLLSGSSAANVEAVEVITTPPAKYDAEGGLLIDIKMKNNLVAGYNGSVFNRYIQGVFPKHTLGTDHYFKAKKTDFSVNYSFTDDKDLIRYTDRTNFFENDLPSAIWTAQQNTITKRMRHNVSMFYDYLMDDKNKISLSTINTLTPKGNQFSFSETNIVNVLGIDNGGFVTTNDSDYQVYNTSFYLDWIHQLNNKGSELSFNAHYTRYNYDNGQDIDTDFFDAGGTVTGENDFITNSLQNTVLVSIQTDYTAKIGTDSTLESGLRFAAISSDNTIEQEGFDRSQPGIDPTEAGEFLYNERITAGYLSINNNWDKWRLNLGLRAEYTETEGDLDTAAESNKNQYLEFFPSFSLKHTFKEKHVFKLNYFRRITRPRYSWLNPFQYFQNNNTVLEGSPDLLPSFNNFLTLGYTLNKALTFQAFYNLRTDDFIQQVSQDNEGNLLRFIATNLDETTSYGLDVIYNKNVTDRWYCYILFNYYFKKNNFRDFDSGQLLENTAFITYFRTIQGFTFLEDNSLSVDASFSWNSPFIIGNATQETLNEFGLSFRKTIWSKNASISLSVEDIFNQSNPFLTRQYLTQDNSSSVRAENRLFLLGFRYAFGNTRIRDNQKSKRIDERNRI